MTQTIHAKCINTVKKAVQNLVNIKSRIRDKKNRMALEFLGQLNSNNNTETYGFQSITCPPAVEELSDFEKDLLLMIKNIEFRKINNSFQEKLSNDINKYKTAKKYSCLPINPDTCIN